MKKILMMAATAALAVGYAAPAGADSETLAQVKANGALKCGVVTGLAGFGAPNDAGEWEGFDIDMCRAVAAAVFGDAAKVEYKPTTGKTRFPALQSGEIDMLARNTTWTFSRDVNLGFEFAGVNYYDGQGFMVRKELGVKSALELSGASVCIQTGTTTELNLADYFRTNGMDFTSVVVEDAAEARQNYDAGRCDVYTTDRSGLAAQRSVLSDPDAHVVLPEVISKEPLGPLVRHGDNEWGDIVRWTLNALIIAEELGISQGNLKCIQNASDPDVAPLKSKSGLSDNDLPCLALAKNPEVARLLGIEGNYGEMLGLPVDWAANAIAAVGNYGEVYARHLGPATPLQLDRGVNELWTRGGILYAPPFR